MADSYRLDKIVARTGDLPSVPAILHDVMELTSDPNISLSEVSDLISKDIGLTAKLLKISNSPYYGMRQVVGTLKLALVILGVREVRNIVLGISVLDTLRDEETEVLMGEGGLWGHSIVVAGIAKKLGTQLELSLQGEDFIAGLIHDIGKLILWKQLGREYRDMYRRAARDGLELYRLENDAYGFDHADVAAEIAKMWRFPTSLESAIRCHHQREDRILAEASAPMLAALVRISDLAAHDKYDPEDPSATGSSLDKEAWSILGTMKGRTSEAARSAMLYNFREDLKGTPSLVF